ncbi:MAG: hypothetical protein GX446_18960 [Chthonomonadales bacterium]|nr:hypothetical protein [Chthonomonadales bacterium]
MQALLPELAHRLRASGIRLYRPFVLGLQSGPSCTLQRSQTGDLVARAGLPEDSAPYDMVHLADGELARAILGAVTASDVLDRAPISPSARVRRIFSALFAERCPHMYLPDRY